MTPLRIAIATLIVLMGWPMNSPASAACSCVVDPVKSSHVYIGTVTRVEFLDSLREFRGLQDPDPRAEPRIIVDLDIETSWTDPLPGVIRLHTIYNRVSCPGYWFQEGGRYLFVATRNWQPEDPEEAAATWPPPATYGVWYCGVWEPDRWDPIIEELDSQRPRYEAGPRL